MLVIRIYVYVAPRYITSNHITSNATLDYGSETWILYEQKIQKLEAVQLHFLIPPVVFTGLDHQRSFHIREGLKIANKVEENWRIMWSEWKGAALHSWRSVTYRRDDETWDDQNYDGQNKAISKFIGTGLTTEPYSVCHNLQGCNQKFPD
jgi:hypothetical protein